MAAIVPRSPLKMAGMTRLMPMLAVLRMPHWILRMNVKFYPDLAQLPATKAETPILCRGIVRFRRRIVVDHIRNRSCKSTRNQTVGRPCTAAVEAGIIFQDASGFQGQRL
jgi:hypothetical protein